MKKVEQVTWCDVTVELRRCVNGNWLAYEVGQANLLANIVRVARLDEHAKKHGIYYRHGPGWVIEGQLHRHESSVAATLYRAAESVARSLSRTRAEARENEVQVQVHATTLAELDARGGVIAIEALLLSARARSVPLYREIRILEAEIAECQRLLDAAKQEA